MKKVILLPIAIGTLGIALSVTNVFAFQPKETAKYFNGPTVSAVTTTSAMVSLSEAVVADITTEEKAGVYFEYFETNKVCIALYPTPAECLPKKTPVGMTSVALTNLKPNTSYTVVYKRDNTIRCITTPCPSNDFVSLSTTFVTASGTTQVPTPTNPGTGGDVLVPSPPEVTSVTPVVETAEAISSSNNLAYLKSRGARLIRMRVNSLNDNARMFAASKNLTADQKTAFAAYFADQVAQLNALNVKIQAGTDASSTKPLVTSIFTDFRIYAIVIPQVRLEKRIYELQNHVGVLTSTTFPKIQAAIDASKAEGKDVTQWQSNLDAVKVAVASDTAKLPVLLMQIASLKPADYGTTSRATILSVNAGVRAIARDLEYLRLRVKRPELIRFRASGKMMTTFMASSSATSSVGVPNGMR